MKAIGRFLRSLRWAPKVKVPDGEPPLAFSADEFIEGLQTVRARMRGRTRALTEIDTIVIHRMWKLGAKDGVDYVARLGDGRSVSWHYTVDHETGEIWKHLPLSRSAFHCKYPLGTNARSVGIEIGGPTGSPISRKAHDSVRKLVRAICDLCPVDQVGSHRFYDSLGPRANRTDPGDEFNWKCLAGLGVELCP